MGYKSKNSMVLLFLFSLGVFVFSTAASLSLAETVTPAKAVSKWEYTPTPKEIQGKDQWYEHAHESLLKGGTH